MQTPVPALLLFGLGRAVLEASDGLTRPAWLAGGHVAGTPTAVDGELAWVDTLVIGLADGGFDVPLEAP